MELRQLLVAMVLLTNASLSYANQLFVSKPLTSNGQFTTGIEGPAVDKDGMLYAVNFQREGTIGLVKPNGEATLFARLPQGSIGNGIRFSMDGAMYIADYTGHNVLVMKPGEDRFSVYAHHPEMNQPNDIAISASGFIYASDPNWKTHTGQLWMITPQQQVVRIESNMGTTNGIEVSPDESKLYVNESVQRKIWRFDIAADGTPTNKRLFYKFEDFGLDGMRVDQNGNLYIARYGAGKIAVISPAGRLLHEIYLHGKFPTNVAFGGKDGKTLYVTMQKNSLIETFRVPTAGRSFKLHQTRSDD